MGSDELAARTCVTIMERQSINRPMKQERGNETKWNI